MILEKIHENLRKIEISYRKTYPKDQDSALSNDYPFKNFWIDYLKIGRKFFKKSEVYNIKGTIESELNSTNKITDFKTITNEIAILLEENKFIENLLHLLVSFNLNLFRRMS
jgi:hypothetical protein